MAVLAPMPRATVRTAMIVKPGDFTSIRRPKRRSCKIVPIFSSSAPDRCEIQSEALASLLRSLWFLFRRRELRVVHQHVVFHVFHIQGLAISRGPVIDLEWHADAVHRAIVGIIDLDLKAAENRLIANRAPEEQA